MNKWYYSGPEWLSNIFWIGLKSSIFHCCGLRLAHSIAFDAPCDQPLRNRNFIKYWRSTSQNRNNFDFSMCSFLRHGYTFYIGGPNLLSNDNWSPVVRYVLFTIPNCIDNRPNSLAKATTVGVRKMLDKYTPTSRNRPIEYFRIIPEHWCMIRFKEAWLNNDPSS